MKSTFKVLFYLRFLSSYCPLLSSRFCGETGSRTYTFTEYHKTANEHSFVTKSLPIPYRTKTVTICPKMTAESPNLSTV